jgi:hypothetical protein
MNIDTAMHYLQSDLRHCLENPSKEAKVALIAAIEDLLPGVAQADHEESGRWWALKMMSLTRLFTEKPSQPCYRLLVRMANQYCGLVDKGLIIPQGMTRSLAFDGNRDWWPQELEDKIINIINNPNSSKLRGFAQRLGEFCEIKRFDAT